MDSTKRPISLIMNSFSIEELMNKRSKIGVGTARSRKATALPQTSRLNLPDRDHVLCSIYETNSLQPEVGLVFLHMNTSAMTVTQIVDSQTYVRTIHKISIHMNGKMDLIVPNSYINPKNSILVKLIGANFPDDINIIGIKEKYFSGSTGLESLAGYFDDSWLKTVLPELKPRHSLCSAIFASIRYANESNNFDFIHDKFNFKFEAPDSTMFMDMNTIRSLELITSREASSKGLTLLSFLDKTNTPMGKRMLRTNILQPLTDKDSIVSRHEATQELIDNPELLKLIKAALKESFDLDKLFSFLTKKPKITLESVSDKNINNILMMKEVLRLCHSISRLLDTFQSGLLKQVTNILRHADIDNSLALINEYINEDCIWARKPLELRAQQCHAIKSNTNGLLDVNRQLYKELVDEILEYIAKMGEDFQLLLESKYNSRRGFFISIKNPPKELADVFISKVYKKDVLECTTLSLMKLNMRFDSVLDEVLLISEQIVELLTSKLKSFLSTFFMISEAIAMLDLLTSLASCVTESSFLYTSIEITDSIMIKQSRHPLLETIMKSKFIPNDIISLFDTSRVQILTGVNMSGKSVYLRQICLLQIMAQIGSFVPADYASIRLYKSLHARISPDALQENMSTFSSEMTDIAFILERGDSDSLVIIDELCRGTSYMDGISLSIAIIEKLIALKCTAFISTHCVDVVKVLKDQTCVLEMYMETKENRNKFIMNYKISTGINEITGYGIRSLKNLPGFPELILNKASTIAEAIRKANESSYKSEDPGTLVRMEKKKLIIDLYTALKHVFKFSSEENLLIQLRYLEATFVNKMSELMEENNVLSEEELLQLSVDDLDVGTNNNNKENGKVGRTEPKSDQLHSVDEFIDFSFAADDSN